MSWGIIFTIILFIFTFVLIIYNAITLPMMW
jgi:hypothetical protein